MNWDKGLEYSQVYNKLKNELENLRERLRKEIRPRFLRYFYMTATLLIQLRNGSRVSEALEALEKFLKSRKREVQVRVRKHKKEDYRLMIVPKEIYNKDIIYLKMVSGQITVNAVKIFALRRYGFNTHSLRYAFITYLAKKGVSAQLIAKITRHKNLNYILTYTQTTVAEDLLRTLM